MHNHWQSRMALFPGTAQYSGCALHSGSARWQAIGHPLAQFSQSSSSQFVWSTAVAPKTGQGKRTPQQARLEAVLFVADAPLSVRKLFDAAKLHSAAQCLQLIAELNVMYDADGSAFRIEQIASGYQLLTRPHYSRWLDRIHQRNIELKLSPPALETLTIIAYQQPLTRADIEAIRGVQSSEVIKQLMEKQLIRIGGEEDSLGRPYLYETTRQFLQYMGIRRVDQLPDYAELCRNKQAELAQATSDQLPAEFNDAA